MPEEGQVQNQQGGLFRYLFPLLVFLVLNNTLRNKQQPKDVTQIQQVRAYLPEFLPGQVLDYEVVLKVDEIPQSSWILKNVRFGDSATASTNLTLSLADVVERNLSAVASIKVFKSGSAWPTITRDVPIIIHKKRRIHKKKNLLSANATKQEPPQPNTFAPFFKPSLAFCIVEDWSTVTKAQLPPQMAGHYHFDEDTLTYKPILFVNEFWLLSEHLIELNDTHKELNSTLHVAVEPVGLIKWQILTQMEQSFAAQSGMGLGDGHDDIKRMLLETNPYLLALTFFVTMLHSVFDILAFKNDIAFWKNKQDVKGLSVKSIMMNTVCQLIIFLYLMDNETSWVVLISSGVGVLIEAWKIKKACNIEVERGDSFLPKIRISNKASYSDATKKHDDTAVRWMSYLLTPCVIGYAVYSVIYQEHKSWYSFVLNTLVGFIYTFGFIMMTPQLFINYKMKSVAHLPWKTFTYKALNTFIDDLFAFIIKMPTLHRLSCFRDDLIFFIYLYQRWIYPVDASRTNEYGQRGDGAQVVQEEIVEQHTKTE